MCAALIVSQMSTYPAVVFCVELIRCKANICLPCFFCASRRWKELKKKHQKTKNQKPKKLSGLSVSLVTWSFGDLCILTCVSLIQLCSYVCFQLKVHMVKYLGFQTKIFFTSFSHYFLTDCRTNVLKWSLSDISCSVHVYALKSLNTLYSVSFFPVKFYCEFFSKQICFKSNFLLKLETLIKYNIRIV